MGSAEPFFIFVFMNIVPASQNAFSSAIRLLEKCSLPNSDINPGTQLFVMEDRDMVAGTVAIEYDYNDALLRSLSVDEQYRNKGIGDELLSFIENYVKRQGVQNIYLLTTTAEKFFLKRRYEKMERSEVPQFIQSTSEYCSVCPSTATLMKKTIA